MVPFALCRGVGAGSEARFQRGGGCGCGIVLMWNALVSRSKGVCIVYRTVWEGDERRTITGCFVFGGSWWCGLVGLASWLEEC